MVEIVAEISGNHGGTLFGVLDLIRRAAYCDCDYAKFQYYQAEDMPDRGEGDNEEMYNRLRILDEWLPAMFDTARVNNIGLFASVFSVRALKELLKYDMPYVKIASPDSTRLPYETYDAIVDAIPRHVGLIISAGPRDGETMWNWARWGRPFKRMYCPPGHPQTLIDEDYTYGWHHSIEGFSDHTSGISVPLSMIREFPATLRMIEKHLRGQGDNSCQDAAFSAEPDTMKLLCRLAHRNK